MSQSSLSTFHPQQPIVSTFIKPDSWVQKQYFSQPVAHTKDNVVGHSYSVSGSRYVKHSQSEVGRPSATWMGTVPPR